jgi:hypothetical protein
MSKLSLAIPVSCKVDALRVFVQQGVEWVMPE